MRTRQLLYFSLSVLLGTATLGCEVTKSENPLSPSVAGPIAGVEITAPKLLEPATGALISGDRQPITLLIENASSNGPRPLGYLFEVATDAGFNNRVFERNGVPAGTGGRTSLTLPDRLGTGRGYYWRAKADDGANAGPYSAPVSFNIFTPVAFEKPVLVAPVNGVRVSDNVPDFRIANAPRAGSPSGVSYIIEVASNSAFANLIAAWQVSEQPNQTVLTSPSGLPSGAQLFWRARAVEPTTTGPWSDTQNFSTPVPVVSTPTPAPGSNGACSSNTPLGILQCRRSQFPTPMSSSQIVSFLKLSASDMNRAGVANGPYGILRKSNGHSCGGYSCDIICSGNTPSTQRQHDVLLDVEVTQTVLWGDPKTGSGIRFDVCEIQ